MRVWLPALAVVASLTACGGGDDNDTKAAGTKVFKLMGSLQCSGRGVSLAALQAQLTAAKVEVHSAACGTDGRATPAVCGTSDGKIGIFEIPAYQSAAATAAGFAPLNTLAGAQTTPCS